MSEQNTYFVANESQMEHLGASLLAAMQGRGIVHLQGDLGMGKTTLCRGVLRAAGHVGAVKSPTYTLVEPYELTDCHIYHFDLYRLVDPEELEYLGIRDYFSEDALCLIEWPEKGEGLLPEPDLVLYLRVENSGRLVRWSALTAKGQRAAVYLQSLKDGVA